MSVCRRIFLGLLTIVSLLAVVAAVSVHAHSRLHQQIARLQPSLAAGFPVEASLGARGPAGGITRGSVASAESELRALSARAAASNRLVRGTSITAAALAILVAVLLWQSISGPLTVLLRSAREISAGRLDARVPMHAPSEWRIFGSALNSMADQLVISMRCTTTLLAIQRTLQQSLDEKELLLREAHHRIKNNLQVLSSLLDMQSRAVGERRLAEEFEVSQSRIRCMALVHDQLYGAGRFDRIAAREYLDRLASHLVDSFGRPRGIRLWLELEDLQLDVDRAMTLGLLTNELLTNALKHAFPAERSGEVHVTLAKSDGSCVLTVADNGVGMRPAPPAAKTLCLGMNLVATLARQLHGSVSIQGLYGTCVSITFPIAAGVQEVPAS